MLRRDFLKGLGCVICTPKLITDLGSGYSYGCQEVPIEDIVIPKQFRLKVCGYREELLESIRERGVLQHLLVGIYGKKVLLIDGFFRLHAIKALGWKAVPCLVLPISDQRILGLFPSQMSNSKDKG